MIITWRKDETANSKGYRECREIVAHCRKVWRLLKKLNIELPMTQQFHSKQNMYTNVHSNIIHNSKDLEPTQMPISDTLDKENVAHRNYRILCSHEKDEFMSFAETWMKLETIILGKLTQEQKTKHYISSQKEHGRGRCQREHR